MKRNPRSAVVAAPPHRGQILTASLIATAPWRTTPSQASGWRPRWDQQPPEDATELGHLQQPTNVTIPPPTVMLPEPLKRMATLPPQNHETAVAV